MDVRPNLSVKCNHCEKSFFDNQILSLHIKSVHQIPKKVSRSKNRKSICNKCERICSSPNALKRHMIVVHEKSKDFVCNPCNKSFFT